MSIFQQTLEQSDERFLRDVGISKATFQQLLDKVATYLAVQREIPHLLPVQSEWSFPRYDTLGTCL